MTASAAERSAQRRVSKRPSGQVRVSLQYQSGCTTEELRCSLPSSIPTGDWQFAEVQALVSPDKVLLRIGPIEVNLQLPAALSRADIQLGDILALRFYSLPASQPLPGPFMIGDAPSLPSLATLDSGQTRAPSAKESVDGISNRIQDQANTRVLQVGQTINARVLEISSQGTVKLEVGNQILKAELATPQMAGLRPGQSVQLQLLTQGPPPLLRLLPESTGQEAQTQLLRQLLPRQSGLDQLLSQTQQLLVETQASDSSNSQQALIKNLAQILQQVASQQTDSKQVQQAINQLTQYLMTQQSGNQQNSGQLQQALSQLSQQLASQNPSNNQQVTTQLQQALQQLSQQLGGQNPSNNQQITTQLQQALNQLSQQLSGQTPTTSLQDPNQLQQTSGQSVDRTPKEAIKQLLQELSNQIQKASSQQTANPPTQANASQAQAANAANSAPQQALDIEKLLQLLNEHSLEPAQINPKAIQDLFLGSGLFLEASLARGRAPRANDLKSLLLRMVTILQGNSHQSGLPQLMQRLISRQTSNLTQGTAQELQTQVLQQLRKASEGALAKLELQQLQSLPHKDDETRQSWHFALTLTEEAKFREVEARIEREKGRKQQEAGDRWNVELHFDFEESGPMDARIQLQKEQIQVNFWASRSTTLDRIKALLPRLEQALAKAGLEVTHLAAWPGEQPRPKSHKPEHRTQLVNLQA